MHLWGEEVCNGEGMKEAKLIVLVVKFDFRVEVRGENTKLYI
jgi:hypothetical protein